jgi:hypothetical protein
MKTKTWVVYDRADVRYTTYYEPRPPEPFWNVLIGQTYARTNSIDYGDNVPSWRRVIGLHENATTFLESRCMNFPKRNWQTGTKTYEKIGDPTAPKATGEVAGYLCSPNISSVPATFGNASLTTAKNRALSNFIAKVTQAQQALQGLVALGEVGETVKMVRSPLKAIYEGNFKYLEAVINGTKGISRLSSLARRANAVKRIAAGLWLEYSFGWKPLIADIESGCEALARIRTYNMPYQHIQALGKEMVISEVIQDDLVFSVWNLKRKVQVVDSASYKIYGDVVTSLPGANTTLGQLGFRGWRDFVPTIWELLPYSFLDDYFSNIGSILQAFAFNTADVRWCSTGSRSERSHAFVSLESVPTADPPGYRLVSEFFRPIDLETVTAVNNVRSPTLDTWFPSLEFSIPGMGLKWLNMAALLNVGRETTRRIARL